MKRDDDYEASLRRPRRGTTDLPLFDTPPVEPAFTRRRSADPATSNEAAEKVSEHITAVQERVLEMFREHGDMTDARLLEVLNDVEGERMLKPTSPSGARSRRNELSQENMERLNELARDAWAGDPERQPKDYWALPPEGMEAVRIILRIEGLRAPLWDTGKREKNENGYNVIVWGMAK